MYGLDAENRALLRFRQGAKRSDEGWAPRAGQGLSFSSVHNAGRLATGVKAAGLALLATTFLSGCMGGPGAYFESVSRDARKSGVEQPTDLAALSVDPVEQQSLAPIGNAANGETHAPQTGNLAAAGNAPAATPSPLPGEPAPQAEPAGTGTLAPPTALTLSGDTEILTVPTLAQPQGQALQQAGTGALPGVSTGPTTNSNAYSDANYASTIPQATALLGTGSGFSIGTQSEPLVDPYEQAAERRIPQLYASIKHGQCKSGRGPQPKRMGAKNITTGDPYYIEIRMRQTPLMPVGHTYVAYGKLGGNGEILSEKLIMLAPMGGYVGAAMASGVPMPGVLTPHPDDCRIRPDIAYRVSLNAQRYERLLQEIRSAKKEKPRYLLFANNCNHFMTRIAGSVGIRPPKNIYVPAVQYLHDMIEANEGIKVARW